MKSSKEPKRRRAILGSQMLEKGTIYGMSREPLEEEGITFDYKIENVDQYIDLSLIHI